MVMKKQSALWKEKCVLKHMEFVKNCKKNSIFFKFSNLKTFFYVEYMHRVSYTNRVS